MLFVISAAGRYWTYKLVGLTQVSSAGSECFLRLCSILQQQADVAPYHDLKSHFTALDLLGVGRTFEAQDTCDGCLHPPHPQPVASFFHLQSSLGYCALSMATLHTLLFGWDRAFDPDQYHFFLPPTFTLVLILPMAVLLGRMVLFVPCVAMRLRQIRRGWEKRRHIRFTLPEDGCRNGLEDVSQVWSKQADRCKVPEKKCVIVKLCMLTPDKVNMSANICTVISSYIHCWNVLMAHLWGSLRDKWFLWGVLLVDQ